MPTVDTATPAQTPKALSRSPVPSHADPQKTRLSLYPHPPAGSDTGDLGPLSSLLTWQGHEASPLLVPRKGHILREASGGLCQLSWAPGTAGSLCEGGHLSWFVRDFPGWHSKSCVSRTPQSRVDPTTGRSRFCFCLPPPGPLRPHSRPEEGFAVTGCLPGGKKEGTKE